MKVERQVVHASAGGAMVHLRPDRRFRPRCHACGRPGTIHSDHQRIVRDLNLADTRVWLQVRYRKVACPACQRVRVEDLGFVAAGQRVTRRLARYIYALCRDLPAEVVARHVGVDPKTVRAIDRAGLEAEFGRTDYEGLAVLAIDEIALKRGHRYMTVVLDHLTGRVVWMGEDRTEATLETFFAGMTEVQKQGIRAVALDMWPPYIRAVQRHLPHARIVFDLFHLVRAFAKVIKRVRDDQFLLTRHEDRRVFRGTHYLLLKNADRLTSRQRTRLNDLLQLNGTLQTLYLLKDQLKAMYRERFIYRVRWALEDWIRMAETIRHPEMQAFVRRLKSHAYGILNHGRFAIGTSRLEGVNNTIKVLKRRGYGYTDSRYFALKVKQAFPGTN
jgi:transposase